MLATTASLAVIAVETVGESVVVVLNDVSTGASISIKASGEALGQGVMAVGTVLAVAAGVAGYSIYQGSRLIAFIPNEIGKSLVHHSKVTQFMNSMSAVAIDPVFITRAWPTSSQTTRCAGRGWC